MLNTNKIFSFVILVAMLFGYSFIFPIHGLFTIIVLASAWFIDRKIK